MAPLEHEACAQDISELRWDLDNWLEEKKEMEKQVLAAVEKNKLLQNSIEELTAQWLVFQIEGYIKLITALSIYHLYYLTSSIFILPARTSKKSLKSTRRVWKEFQRT